jgi:hypothetical protein
MMLPKFEGFTMDNNKLLIFKSQIYVLPNDALRSFILNDAYKVVYMAHLGVMKMRAYLNSLILLERNEGIHSQLRDQMSRMLVGEG